jgi:hypothetical protein
MKRVQQTLCGAVTDLINRLSNRGQRGRQVLGGERVIKTDDGDILGDAQTMTPQHTDR